MTALPPVCSHCNDLPARAEIKELMIGWPTGEPICLTCWVASIEHAHLAPDEVDPFGQAVRDLLLRFDAVTATLHELDACTEAAPGDEKKWAAVQARIARLEL